MTGDVIYDNRNVKESLFHLQIKELETFSGIKAHTIRIWEMRYQLLKPERNEGNIRFYSIDEFAFLLTISLLLKNGHKISHLAKLDRSKISEKVSRLIGEKNHVVVTFNALIISVLKVDIMRFEEILNDSIKSRGLHETVMVNLIPLINKIIESTKIKNSIQTDIIIAMVRNKILVALDLVAHQNFRSEIILVFLPSGNYFEILVLLSAYLLTGAGYKIVYLGANTPIDTFIVATDKIKPHHFISSAVSRLDFDKLLPYAAYLNTLSRPLKLNVAVSTREPIKGLFERNILEFNYLNAVQNLER
jgi:MerR family transcriptional regulator, light-induced transcriptional regulator